MNERRKHRRLDLHLPIICRREGSSRCLTTTTRNISSGGVCFELVTSETPAVGGAFEVEISVPRSQAGHGPDTLINSMGRVCRIEQIDRKSARPTHLCIAIQFVSPLQLSV